MTGGTFLPKEAKGRELCNPQVFENLYDQFAAKIYRYAFLRLSSKEDAEDILISTFLRLLEYLQRNPQRIVQHPGALIYRIARNLIIDQYRGRIPSVSVELLLTEGFEIPAATREDPQHKAEQALVLQALSKVDVEERDILLLRFIEGISVKEIAEMYGITENNASVRIHRALQKLKEVVQEGVK